MTIKFKGYLTEINRDNLDLEDVYIGLRIFKAQSNEVIYALYDMLQAGQPIEVILGKEPEPILQEPYTIINANCVSGLQREVEEKLKAGYLLLGAPFWHNKFIFQAMKRGIN